MSQYFGLDGGGSKTHLAIANDKGNLINMFHGESTNHQTTHDAAYNFFRIFSNIRDQHFAVGVVCVAGWDFESDKKIVRSNVKSALEANNIEVGQLIIENDVFAILKSGLGKNPNGVVLAAGTGAICACVKGNELFRTYSCGFVSGEWGSGHDMAEYAIHLICASEKDIDEPCPILKKMALIYFKVDTVDNLIERVVNKKYSVQFISMFMEKILEAYNSGCIAAKKVLEKGGRYHAKSVFSMLKKFEMKNVPVILGGGVFCNLDILPGFIETLKILNGQVPKLKLVKSKPVYGSILWALQVGGANTNTVTNKIQVELIEESKYNPKMTLL